MEIRVSEITDDNYTGLALCEREESRTRLMIHRVVQRTGDGLAIHCMPWVPLPVWSRLQRNDSRQAVQFRTIQRAVMLSGWEGNRRSSIALAMRYRVQWSSHLRALGLKGDEMSTPPTQ